jgi:hypothetical protein
MLFEVKPACVTVKSLGFGEFFGYGQKCYVRTQLAGAFPLGAEVLALDMTTGLLVKFDDEAQVRPLRQKTILLLEE